MVGPGSLLRRPGLSLHRRGLCFKRKRSSGSRAAAHRLLAAKGSDRAAGPGKTRLSLPQPQACRVPVPGERSMPELHRTAQTIGLGTPW